MDNLAIANSAIVWALCGVTVIIALLQAVLFARMARRTAKSINLPNEISNKAFRIGMISAIGPALGVFIVMVGLMAAIGSPMAWLRLSIIGAAPTELTAASHGAAVWGVTLGSKDYTLVIMATSWFAMALNGAGWLVFTGLFTPSLEKLRNKMAGGDMMWLGVLSAACSLGVFGFLCHSEILKGWGNALCAAVGAFTMIFLVKVVVKKVPRLMEYSLGIAMIMGMIAGVLYTTYAA